MSQFTNTEQNETKLNEDTTSIDNTDNLSTTAESGDIESGPEITPWSVKTEEGGDINDERVLKNVTEFGAKFFTSNSFKRMETITGQRVPHWVRRNIIASGRDMDEFFDMMERYKCGDIKVFAYTGRGPSTEAMHLGHMLPFKVTKWLQDAFQIPVIIQMSDDEKFAFKGDFPLERYVELSYLNARDIIACGFDPAKTWIFSNTEEMGGALYKNVMRVSSLMSHNKLRSIYGFDGSSTSAMIEWPSKQAAPAFGSSFPDVLGLGPNEKAYCIVPLAYDQDPYFRMTRDVAPRMGEFKPAVLHLKFLVGLRGKDAKMSSTGAEPTIYMTDTIKSIKKTINQHAFSGGQQTLELHRELGGNLSNDIAYQYLMYFMEDDARLEEIAHQYRSGEMLSGQIKQELINIIVPMVEEHQRIRNSLTDEDVQAFFTRRELDFTFVQRPELELHPDAVYDSYGSGFDETFGLGAPTVSVHAEEEECVAESTA
jgi:tryptophanyl-tRNA synthetase